MKKSRIIIIIGEKIRIISSGLVVAPATASDFKIYEL